MLLAPAQRRRPNANSFFEKRVTGEQTKKEFGRTCRGKSDFPSVPLRKQFFSAAAEHSPL